MSSLFPFLPVFLDLVGKRVVVLGGDANTAAKARLFLDAGAGVDVFDPEPGPDMRALAPPARLVTRGWKPSDFDGASLIACGPTERRVSAAKRAAKARRALFYVIDALEQSDFAFGAFAQRGALAVGVSTAGLAPALGQAVRRRIEAVLPEWLEGFLEAASVVRSSVEARLKDPAARRRFWADAADAAFDQPQPDWRKWLLLRLEIADDQPAGTFDVVRVPIDPRMLTLADAQVLSRAEIAFVAKGTSPIAIGMLRRDSERRPAIASDAAQLIGAARRDSRRIVVIAPTIDHAVFDAFTAAWTRNN
jgi:uroporphyrin-III C-methyltransferase / precorrin-2 dehydrogenase / sirohydrochlorin ferrochelatase